MKNLSLINTISCNCYRFSINTSYFKSSTAILFFKKFLTFLITLVVNGLIQSGILVKSILAQESEAPIKSPVIICKIGKAKFAARFKKDNTKIELASICLETALQKCLVKIPPCLEFSLIEGNSLLYKLLISLIKISLYFSSIFNSLKFCKRKLS